MRRWAGCSRSSPSPSDPANLQSKTAPASISIRESAPKPTSAIEPATTPAPMATAASIPCHARPRRASSFARRTRCSRSLLGAEGMTGSAVDSTRTRVPAETCGICSVRWRFGRSRRLGEKRTLDAGGVLLKTPSVRSDQTADSVPKLACVISGLAGADSNRDRPAMLDQVGVAEANGAGLRQDSRCVLFRWEVRKAVCGATTDGDDDENGNCCNRCHHEAAENSYPAPTDPLPFVRWSRRIGHVLSVSPVEWRFLLA
jgi:hypothetical protein